MAFTESRNKSRLNWHLQKAEISLACWYSDAQWWLDMAKQFVFASKECKQLSLRCKTEGLVWYDRYKMILDCNRKVGGK